MSPGFHGKLPALGDFVTRRLPGEFIQPWDLWLRESLAASQARLGDGWLDIYLTSPLWRFALAPGLAGQGAWAGVLMPSVDRVGRYYPLTLAAPLPPGTDLIALMSDPDWFERAEVLALSGLEDSCTVETFDARVIDLGAPPGAARETASPVAAGVTARSNAWRLEVQSLAGLQRASQLLLARALEQMYCAYSFWWSSGSERVAPSLLTCQGLPPADGFSALLDGDWTRGGWWELQD
ncbi:type VI secretion-associated protein [Thiocystis violacea]|nr:type VI secretion-associated protein [Thiocystis violacea]